MDLQVNGKQHTATSQRTIAELLAELGVTATHVAVEVNQQLIPRTEHQSHQLTDGDQLEIVTLVGGG